MRSIQRHNKINRQITGFIILAIAISLSICCIINACFLGDFYIYQKENQLSRDFDNLHRVVETGVKYDENFALKFLERCSHSNFEGLIVSSDWTTVINSVNDHSHFTSQMQYLLQDISAEYTIVRTKANYSIYSVKFPDATGKYLVLIGSLSDGNTVFFKCNVEGIEETALIATNFTIGTAVIAILISSYLAFIYTRKYTKPLFDIINITKRISNFEFEAKYTPQRIYNELDDLGEHVNEMSITLERAISQLRAANEKLKKDLVDQEEMETIRKEFIANVSHELKTPIALIQGYAEGLQEGIIDDPDSRNIYLDIIIDESNRMNRLVREMLILNQLEAGQMDSDMCAFDVTEVINGIIAANQIFFEGQSIIFDFPDNNPCYVVADEFLVEQVFSNFMSNAIHYVMNENEIKVTYRFDKKGKVRIGVYNSGNNIPKKDIKHIWEKFYKVDKARSREYGGSGIGLSVVKAVMDLLHEKFGVENLENGVEFWFELPLVKDEKNKQNS